MKELWKKAAVHTADMLLLFTVQLGTLYFIIKTFLFQTDAKLLYFTLIFSAACYGFMKTKRLKICFGIVMAALAVYMLYPYRSGIVPSVYGVAERFAARYTYVFYGGNNKNGSFFGDCTGFFAIVSMCLSVIFAASICGRRRRLAPAAIEALAVFVPCIIVSVSPHRLSLIALLAFWSVCLICAPVRRGSPYSGAVMIFIALPLLFALYGGVLYEMKPDEYSLKSETLTRRNQIISLGDKMLGRLGISFSQTGASDDGGAYTPTLVGGTVWSDNGFSEELSQIGPLRRTGAAILRVKSDETGRIYLKGYSLDTYTGSGWISGDLFLSVFTDHSDELTLTAESIKSSTGVQERVLQIEPVAVDSQVMFTPYYYSGSDVQAEEQMREGCVILKETDYGENVIENGSYSVRYVPYDGDFSDITQPAEGLSEYEDSIRRANLALPDGLAQELLQLAGENGISADDDNVMEKVAEFIRSSGAYNTRTRATPEDKDFVLYFLKESHEGYCVHFASAAAAMYRALGIPARYVSGFAFDVHYGGRWQTVTDYSAHAWVEVFISGVGWVPVEVTGGGAASSEEEQTPEPADEPENMQEQDSGRETAPDTKTDNTAPDVKDDNADSAKRNWKGVITAVWIAGASAAAVLLVLLRRRMLLRIRHRSLYGKNPNKCAVNIYRYYKRLSKFGAVMPENMRELADRACFSKSGVSRAETAMAAAMAENAASELAECLDRLKRAAAKYIFCVI